MSELDKYARDAEAWRKEAEATFDASTLLFCQNFPFWFSASILGHHALEMLLKSALIRAGYTIANRKQEDGYVWGHDLGGLATLLASKYPEFSPNLTQLARFDAFQELRYPQVSPHVEYLGPGKNEAMCLADLMDSIRPFALPLPEEE
jgi:HEPN domain-containing protein